MAASRTSGEAQAPCRKTFESLFRSETASAGVTSRLAFPVRLLVMVDLQ
jgi:hypothetical protein